MGRGYVIEHCVSTFLQKQEERNYKIYTAEMLRGIAICLTGARIESYFDLIEKNKRRRERTDNRTAQEIVFDLKDKINGLKGGEDNGRPDGFGSETDAKFQGV